MALSAVAGYVGTTAMEPVSMKRSTWAPLYPLLRRRTGLGPAAAGLATGAAMGVGADELLTPAFGFSAPNLDCPLATHVRGFLAHLVFGLAVATVMEAGWRVSGTRP